LVDCTEESTGVGEAIAGILPETELDIAAAVNQPQQRHPAASVVSRKFVE
jgi:hypothetical protein